MIQRQKRLIILGSILLASIMIAPWENGFAAQGEKPTTAIKPTMSPTTDRTNWPKEIYIGSSGSGTKIIAVVLSDILSRNLAIKVLLQPVSGLDEGLTRLAKGQVHLMGELGGGMKAAPGLVGGGQFRDVPKDGYRALFATNSQSIYLVVRANSNIRSYADLKGKRVGIGGPSADSFREEAFLPALALHGIGPKDIFMMPHVRAKESVEAVTEGTADAMVVVGLDPNVLITEAMRTTPLRILSMTPEEQKAATKTGYLPWTVPGGIYPGHDKPILVFTPGSALMCIYKKLPDNFVYEMTKAIFMNTERIQASYSAFKDLTPRFLSDPALFTIPVHPGAIKYFTEANLWTPEALKKNDQLEAWVKSKL